ncbi:MAG: hypothetical protein AVDCRST_MAG49-1062 [uncultured Thermomicrobiales bacterium]|uniref:N-acetyltransferase domain-containing protein n=1 Tax=uncultured Thermomicrobiales bacterium TaxID=1645740 RepID=A0A6J4U7T7_9BACT|nr:MAG: hypothetical protein AVDCRST_MAG49-1062 [uncultured Thermomicrobiales bacterium]
MDAKSESDGRRFVDRPPVLTTERLSLESLTEDLAEEMAPLLADARLHEFVGGEPLSLPALRARYRRLASGHSPDGGERWLNWVVRRRDDGRAVGTVQATVTAEGDGKVVAWVAWVVGVPSQGQGFASEAATALVRWLAAIGADVVAAIAPGHVASESVARRAGLSVTGDHVDGERVWRLVAAAVAPTPKEPRRRAAHEDGTGPATTCLADGPAGRAGPADGPSERPAAVRWTPDQGR